MATVDAASIREMTDTVPGFPVDRAGPVFKEPWEAQAFALTLTLFDRGLFEWAEWAKILGEEIRKAQDRGDPDTGLTYYHHWVSALERMITEKGASDTATLRNYFDAWDHAAKRTPHGTPIELEPHDFDH